MEFDITTSNNGENKAFLRKKLKINLAGSENHQDAEEEKIHLPEKARSNSVCYYCTGQVERLLDDPDFLKDYDNQKDESFSEEED
mmetsp:Transcript_4819/g.3434  ORF Transcript_4819/g.3434 Transcript_4819/m.3434 type:complete len:85 (+) Transcript_4819:557-811(+)|eukprot:CAMPEP_0202963796 /NCGR_PEP_ID=MMETSP1396-20130829/7816_1 /ASSEMBLY_ACC=CAM_ASM_000872 /TAXON_ID= /ORGANISM="Pseudokeronopsis sp., Strain Brazil" /LENGTH=84 /DNA_ID=CAMNT_0049685317 /DNA_START=557 /DNA_END=811 /DNA_ORIENTATION=-